MRLICTKTNEAGKTAKVYRDPYCDEYVVRFYIRKVDGKVSHQTNADYYTNDKSDALGTAEHYINPPPKQPGISRKPKVRVPVGLRYTKH